MKFLSKITKPMPFPKTLVLQSAVAHQQCASELWAETALFCLHPSLFMPNTPTLLRARSSRQAGRLKPLCPRLLHHNPSLPETASLSLPLVHSNLKRSGKDQSAFIIQAHLLETLPGFGLVTWRNIRAGMTCSLHLLTPVLLADQHLDTEKVYSTMQDRHVNPNIKQSVKLV